MKHAAALAVCLAVALPPASAGAHAKKKAKTATTTKATLPVAANPSGDSWSSPSLVVTSEGGFVALPREPLFALYSGGRVLYANRDGSGIRRFLFTTLTSAEQQALLGDLELDRVGQFHAPRGTSDDAGTGCVFVWHGETEAHDCVDMPLISGRSGDEVPVAMTKIWQRLTSFTSPNAKLWQPEQLFVTVSALEGASHCVTETTLPWPKSWPHRGATGTSQELPGQWSFTLPGTALPELLRLQAGPTPPGCSHFALDGQSYWFSYGFDLPHQAAWLQAP